MLKFVKLFFLFSLPIFFFSCQPEPKIEHLTYQNFIVFSDMSNRLTNRYFPQKDTIEIKAIIENFKDSVNPGVKIGDKSSLYFSALSENKTVSIDLEKIVEIGKKQSFVNSTNEYKNNGFAKKLIDFKDSVFFIYKNISNPGLDLISIFVDRVKKENFIKKDTFSVYKKDTTYFHFENQVYLFTDGYLEYVLAGKKSSKNYYFGNNEINKIRKFCNDKNVDVKTALNLDATLSIPACFDKKHQLINLHVLETLERDKDTKFNRYNNDPGFRDNEILEAVWSKWARESGFKSFEWKKY